MGTYQSRRWSQWLGWWSRFLRAWACTRWWSYLWNGGVRLDGTMVGTAYTQKSTEYGGDNITENYIPAASSPTIKIRISFLPKSLANNFPNDKPIAVWCVCVVAKSSSDAFDWEEEAFLLRRGSGFFGPRSRYVKKPCPTRRRRKPPRKIFPLHSFYSTFLSFTKLFPSLYAPFTPFLLPPIAVSFLLHPFYSPCHSLLRHEKKQGVMQTRA